MGEVEEERSAMAVATCQSVYQAAAARFWTPVWLYHREYLLNFSPGLPVVETVECSRKMEATLLARAAVVEAVDSA
jgi:hypothetical protein